MRFSMSIGPGEAAPGSPPASPSSGPSLARDEELRQLEAQLERMRGMLFGYSSLFFATVRNWTFLCVGLLVLGWSGVLPAAVVPVPFLVPFAFLETGYLFWYTVFARRHAERLEQAINARLGSDVLVAHRLEAAYFYPPDAPKIAGLSFGNPLGFMSAMTVGYSVGAALVWAAGLASAAAYVRELGGGFFSGGLVGLVVPAAIAWTAVIAAYLVWASLRRADEDRLLAALDAAYPPPGPEPAGAEPAPVSGTEPALEFGAESPGPAPAAGAAEPDPTTEPAGAPPPVPTSATPATTEPPAGATPDPGPREA